MSIRMNTKPFLFALACGIVGIAVGIIGLVKGELTTGDIAQFTPEQAYTYDKIKDRVFSIRISQNGTEDTIISDNEAAKKIMEYFIEEGYTYCNKMMETAFPLCGDSDNGDKTYLDDIVKEQYAQIVKEQQSNPFAGLAKFFGFGNMLVFAQQTTGPEPDPILERLYNLSKEKGILAVPTGSLTPELLLDHNIRTPVAFPNASQAIAIISALGWSGEVLEDDGDVTSYDGYGADDITFTCAPGEMYTVALHKTEDSDDSLKVVIITKDEILDVGETTAAYGSVSLSGTC